MKSIFKLLWIIAIAAIIGFSFAACDDGSDSSTKADARFIGIWHNDEAPKRVPGHPNFDATRTDHTITITENNFRLESSGGGWVNIANLKWEKQNNPYTHNERGKADYPSGYLLRGTITRDGFETNPRFAVYLHNDGNHLVVNGFESGVSMAVWNRIYIKQ